MFDFSSLNPEVFMSDNYVVLDLETTNKNFGDAYSDNSLVLTCYRYKGKSYVNYKSVYNQDKLVNLINSVDFVVAHNAKFELKWLRQMGLDLTKVIAFDTMIAEYVLNGNTTNRGDLKLGSMAPKYGIGYKDQYIDLMMKKTCPSELPQSLITKRCVKDVYQTEQIFLAQRQRLKQLELLPVFFTRNLLTPCLADIEYNGMNLDKGRVNEIYYSTVDELEEVTWKLNKFTGGINPKSPKQMCEYLYGDLGFQRLKDKQGNEINSASADVLARLKPRNKTQRQFLDLRKEQARLTALVDKALKHFKACVDNEDYIKAQFNQTVTKTHRLSSSGAEYGVQFQNLPRSCKKLFTARDPDFYMGEIDGAQLEFRVAAFLGQDEVAVYDIVNSVDIHSFTADTLTDAGQDTTRQQAKAHTFKPLFGGMSGTDAEKTYYKAFQEKYKGIYSTQEGWVLEVLRHKKLRLASGLICYWPDTARTRTGYITNTPKIYNLPVQSLATAEIIPVALVKLWHDMKAAETKSFIVNTIHDSAIMEIHKDETKLIQDLSVEAFTTFVYDYLDKIYNIQFNVPLGVGLQIGKFWSQPDSEIADNLLKLSNIKDKENDKGDLKYVPVCPYQEVA